MGSSDEVRRLLDERGIEWWPSNDPCCEDVITHWRVGPFQWTAIEGEKDLWLNAGIAGHEPLTPEQAIAATVGRSCASCPEMDNPDSYISHIHAALEWHDEHVPRPTNPRNTCVVLEGEKVPEEVLFIGANDVTHYLPEVTCQNKGFKDDGGWYFVCSRCGCEFEYADFACEFAEGHGLGSPKFCPNCGRKVVTE